jgi:hypothetical protein
MDPDWALSLRQQCEAAGIAYFFKQAGSILGAEWGMAGKGGHELARVPRELRVRQYPKPVARRVSPETTARSALLTEENALQAV